MALPRRSYFSKDIKNIDNSNRNNRMLAVVAGVGGLIYGLKVIKDVLEESFCVMYIGGFPFGMQHFMSMAILSSLIMILFVAINYVYAEYFSFVNCVSKEKLKEIQSKADHKYLLLLRTCSVNITIIIAVCIFTIFFEAIAKHAIKSLVEYMAFILIVLSIYVIVERPNIYSLIQALFRIIYKAAYIVLIWLFLFWFTFIIGYNAFNSSFHSELSVNFRNMPNASMELVFKDVSSPPDDMIINIQGTKQSKIELHNNEWQKSFVEKTSSDSTEPTQVAKGVQFMDTRDTQYLYRKKVDLSRLLSPGRNYIIITFGKDGISQQNYKLVNEVTRAGETIEFNQDSFRIKL